MADVELFDSLENFTFRLKCCGALLSTIYDDMDRNIFSSATFAPALHAVCEYLNGILEEVQQISNSYSQS